MESGNKAPATMTLQCVSTREAVRGLARLPNGSAQRQTSMLWASSKMSTEFSHFVCSPPRILGSTR